jgi:serine protease Do
MTDASGVVVNSVLPGSPAGLAGLRTGDIITRFDGHPVEAEKEEDLGAFQRLVASVQPGEQAPVEMLREGKPTRADITIGTQPKLDAAEAESEIGIHVQEITANLARDHRLDSPDGAFVVFVVRGSPAREAGLRVGDVIVKIEDRSVANIEDFRREIDRVSTRNRFLLTTRRGEETKYLLVKPGSTSGDDEGEDVVPDDEVSHRKP